MKVVFNILKIRRQKGFSQQYLAQQLGITVKTYARLEQGKGKLTMDTLLEIATIMEVSPYILFNIRYSFKSHRANSNGSSPENFKHMSAHVARLENQLKNAQAESSKLRMILMNRWEIYN